MGAADAGPEFLDSIKAATLTEVQDGATDATSRLSEFTMALKVNHTAQKVSTAGLSASIAMNESGTARAAAELLQKCGASREKIVNDADDQCLTPIACLLVFTDESNGTCLGGDLDESCKSRVQVARTAAKEFLALTSAVREIATKDITDAMSRVSPLMESQ